MYTVFRLYEHFIRGVCECAFVSFSHCYKYNMQYTCVRRRTILGALHEFLRFFLLFFVCILLHLMCHFKKIKLFPEGAEKHGQIITGPKQFRYQSHTRTQKHISPHSVSECEMGQRINQLQEIERWQRKTTVIYFINTTMPVVHSGAAVTVVVSVVVAVGRRLCILLMSTQAKVLIDATILEMANVEAFIYTLGSTPSTGNNTHTHKLFASFIRSADSSCIIPNTRSYTQFVCVLVCVIYYRIGVP